MQACFTLAKFLNWHFKYSLIKINIVLIYITIQIHHEIIIKIFDESNIIIQCVLSAYLVLTDKYF